MSPPSDEFVVYERKFQDRRYVKDRGAVLAAEFVNHGRVRRAVWFECTDAVRGYFTPEGRGMREAFLARR